MGSFVQSDLKEKNRATVYLLLKAKRGLSKADIARESGISAPTVMKIVDYFQKLGIAEGAEPEAVQKSEARDAGSSLGRRPQPLGFNPRAAYALGAAYDGVHLDVGVVDLSGEIHSLVRRKAPGDIYALLSESLEATVDEALREAGLGRDAIVGLGLGIPGTVDADGHTIRFAPLVGMGHAHDASRYLKGLESRMGFPFLLENDANTAALGEFAARGLGPSDDLLFAILGRGLGAGLILGGSLRRGPRASAGEIGYMVFDPASRAAADQPGWLEEKTDLAAFWEESARPGGASRETMARVADHVAVGLANLCVALDLDRVVVGQAGRDLLAMIGERMSRLSVLAVSCEAPITPEPGVSGAAAMAVEKWLSGVFAG